MPENRNEVPQAYKTKNHLRHLNRCWCRS